MAELDLDELRRVAEAATPGPWFVRENDLIGGMCVMPADLPPSSGVHEVGDFMHKDAEYVAAMDPPTTLALLAEVVTLREQVRISREALTYINSPTTIEPPSWDFGRCIQMARDAIAALDVLKEETYE